MHSKKKVGLLGGAFNPAHEGHVYISQKAYDILALDEIWWLVSPQPPLKPKADILPLNQRLKVAKEITKNTPCITQVSDIESQLATRLTYDTLLKLQHQHKEKTFIWLMGEDNLRHFNQWYKWQEISTLVPFAVLKRTPKEQVPIDDKVATYLKPYRVNQEQAQHLAQKKPPAWCYLDIPPHPASSTEIRKNLVNKEKKEYN